MIAPGVPVAGPVERVELSWPEDLPGVEVLVAESCDRRWQVLHHTYTVCTGIAIARPTEWTYRKTTYYQDGDGLTLMEPGEYHANTRETGPASFRVLLVDPAVVEQAARDLGSAAAPHFKFAQLYGRTHPELREAFLTLHRSLERPATSLERQSHFATCLRDLLEQCVEAPVPSRPARADPPVVRCARQFIEAHVADQVSLRELTEVAGAASQFQLIHAFTAASGLPPHAYQIQLRILGARELLAAGVAPADVAAELGFADQSHLTRCFRKPVGVTPAEYSRATRPRFAIWPGHGTARTFKTAGARGA